MIEMIGHGREKLSALVLGRSLVPSAHCPLLDLPDQQSGHNTCRSLMCRHALHCWPPTGLYDWPNFWPEYLATPWSIRLASLMTNLSSHTLAHVAGHISDQNIWPYPGPYDWPHISASISGHPLVHMAGHPSAQHI